MKAAAALDVDKVEEDEEGTGDEITAAAETEAIVTKVTGSAF